VDNTSQRSILVEMLDVWGIKTEVAEQDAPVLALLDEAVEAGRPFALVILDLRRNENARVAKSIRDHPEHWQTRTLILLAPDRFDEGDRWKGAADGHILKPLKHSAVLASIASLLGWVTPDSEPEGASAGPAVEAGSLEILLAEDNRVNQAVARRMLERRGHKVVVVGDGRAAVAAVEGGQFDLVLMDVQMPEMDGFEATAAIRSSETDARHIPIIAMTAHAMKGDRERCISAGMDGYVSKPVHAEELHQAIASIWTNQSSEPVPLL
jgi:CheY-like chemotaxis protein